MSARHGVGARRLGLPICVYGVRDRTRQGKPRLSPKYTRLFLLLLVTAAITTPSAAQNGARFGQWSWRAEAGVSQFQRNRSIEGFSESKSKANYFRLGFDLNGFIVHPYIAEFRVGTNLYLNRNQRNAGLSSDNLGLWVDIRALPKGSYPISVSLARRQFGYAEPTESISFRGRPDIDQLWSINAVAKRGFLRGANLNLQGNNREYYLTPTETDTQTRRDGVFTWNRGNGRVGHKVKLRATKNSQGMAFVDWSDLNLIVDERVKISDGWSWNGLFNGLTRETHALESNVSVRYQDYRLFNRFRLKTPRRDELNLDLRWIDRRRDGLQSESLSFSALYNRRIGRSWRVSPYGGYSIANAGDLGTGSPRIGVVGGWSGSTGRIRGSASARLGFGSTDDQWIDGTPGESQLRPQCSDVTPERIEVPADSQRVLDS